MLQLKELSTPTTLCCDDGYDLLLSCPDDKYPPGPPSFIRFSNATLFFSHFFFFLLIAFFVCEYCMVLFCCLLYVRVDLNRSREFFFLLLVLYTTSQLASTLSALRGCVLTKGDPSQTLTSSQSWVGYDGCGLSLSHSPLLFSRLPHSLFSFTLCLCSQFLGS